MLVAGMRVGGCARQAILAGVCLMLRHGWARVCESSHVRGALVQSKLLWVY
jgi:hypothetical protein